MATMTMGTMGFDHEFWNLPISNFQAMLEEQIISGDLNSLDEDFLNVTDPQYFEQEELPLFKKIKEELGTSEELRMDEEEEEEEDESLVHPWKERSPLLNPTKETWWSVWSHTNEKFKEKLSSMRHIRIVDYRSDLLESWDKYSDPEKLLVMVNPKTACAVNSPEKSVPVQQVVEAKEPPKPYHPCQDHDYVKEMKDDIQDEVKMEGIQSSGDIPSGDEPDVDVWEIDNFCHKKTTKSVPVTEEFPDVYRQIYLQERRASARAADVKRREQARKISKAVHAVLNTPKPQRRKFKNIKPKNSVETTPSQSDIEEFYSQPVRRTYTKATKKKTCKGRIDHSESERHRREVLRTNFSFLCDLIPNEYLRGDKVTSQISKQKILTGAKVYIASMHFSKGSYKTSFRRNRQFRKQWKKSTKLIKSVKRLK